MTQVNAVQIVEDFFHAVWKQQDIEAIDRFVTEDFVITSGQRYGPAAHQLHRHGRLGIECRRQAAAQLGGAFHLGSGAAIAVRMMPKS